MSAFTHQGNVFMSEHHSAEHSSPIKTPGQLIAVVVASFVVPIALISIFAHIVTSGTHTAKDDQELSDAAIAKRLKPVGELVVDPNQPAPAPAAPVTVAAAPAPAVAGKAAPAAAGGDSAKGKSIFDGTCTACHSTGAAGAPKIGDKAAWAPRLKEGMPAVYGIAMKGKGAMPPKGGNAGLSEADVKAAVDYMVSKVK
jgi:cytochrome c5